MQSDYADVTVTFEAEARTLIEEIVHDLRGKLIARASSIARGRHAVTFAVAMQAVDSLLGRDVFERVHDADRGPESRRKRG